jgi:hypothetical protein
MQLTTLLDTNSAIQELEQAFFDIPFENSDFQNEAFVLAAQITPERAYRALGLRMHSKLQALRHNLFAERKRDIQLGELHEKLEASGVSKWDKMRAQIEIEEIESGISYTEKLKNDAIKELECLYKHFKSLPRFTRKQFEDAEANHFQERLKRQASGISGASESLVNISEDIPALIQYEEKVLSLSVQDSQTLELLRLAMPNQLQNVKP